MNIPGKTLIAILAIMILEITAMLMGINGRYLVIGILAIAGLGGYPLIQAFIKK